MAGKADRLARAVEIMRRRTDRLAKTPAGKANWGELESLELLLRWPCGLRQRCVSAPARVQQR